MIEEKVFSFYMADDDEMSMMMFGGYDLQKYARDIKNVAWIPMEDMYFWSCLISGYRIGKKPTYENGRSSEFSITPVFAVFDTGTSLTYLPSCKDFDI